MGGPSILHIEERDRHCARNFWNGVARKRRHVGAVIGGPLVLATIAYAVVGAEFLRSKHKGGERFLPAATRQRLAHDQKWFMLIFVFKIALGVVAFAIKPWLGVLFLLAYAAYVRQEMSADGETIFSIAGLFYFLRRDALRPKTMATFGLLYMLFAAGLCFIPLVRQ
jgi:cation:H+ antiporter